MIRESGDRPRELKPERPSGVTVEEIQTMSQLTAARSAVIGTALSICFVALLGAGLVFLAGHAQSAVLHDAAHDIRHGTGFPCH